MFWEALVFISAASSPTFCTGVSSSRGTGRPVEGPWLLNSNTDGGLSTDKYGDTSSSFCEEFCRETCRKSENERAATSRLEEFVDNAGRFSSMEYRPDGVPRTFCRRTLKHGGGLNVSQVRCGTGGWLTVPIQGCLAVRGVANYDRSPSFVLVAPETRIP